MKTDQLANRTPRWIDSQVGLATLGLSAAVPIGGANTALGLIATCALFLPAPESTEHPVLIRKARHLWGASVCGTVVIGWLNGTLSLLTCTFAVGLSSIIAIARLVYILGSRSEGRSTRLLLAATASGFAVNLLATGLLDSPNPWKYGLGFSIIALVVALATRPDQTRWPVMIIIILLTICLVTASRNLAGTLAIILTVIAFRALSNKRSRYIIVAIILASAVLFQSQIASTVGESQVAQAVEDRFVAFEHFNSNPLLAARIEIPLSIAAIQSEPFYGYGVGTGPSVALVQRASGVATDLGYTVDSNLIGWWTQDDLIYTHSLVAQAWVEGGIFAGLFVLSLLMATAQSVFRLSRSFMPEHVPLMFIGLQICWNFLFSPYGSTIQPLYAVGMGALLYAVKAATSRKKLGK